MRLDYLTWKKAEEYFNEDIIAVLPVGSVEQHGPIGPLGTDYIIPQEIARRLEEKTNIMVLPAMPYGVSPHHMSFPGTINIGHEVLQAVVSNIVESLMQHGVKRFLFLNGHGGNSPALEAVSLTIYHKGGIAALIDWWSLAPQLNKAWLGGHGAGQEASVIMAIKPELINLADAFPSAIGHLSDSLQNIHLNAVKYNGAIIKVVRDVKAVSSNGAFGGPDNSENANTALGQEIMAGVIEYITGFVEEFKKVDLK